MGREPQQDVDVGSPTWVRERLRALPPDDTWTQAAACRELITWLYPVAMRGAGSLGVPPADRSEVAQDAMPRIVSALKASRERIGQARNPAAMLERITGRAVSEGVHRLRMAGFGGVRPSGRTWRTPFPHRVCGDTASDLLEGILDSPDQQDRNVEEAADRVAVWIVGHIGVELTPSALDAVVYVLDRVAGGITRPALVRGGRVGLADDPAMRHLGFEPAGARNFARWLLGRADTGHELPSVLDAALLDESVSPKVLAGWRDAAIRTGFAVETVHTSLSVRPNRSPRARRRVA